MNKRVTLKDLPKCSGLMSLTEVWIAPPTALTVRAKSSAGTRPAQKMSRSAKYWVAKSPIGSLERTTLAPVWTIFSNFS